MLTSGGDVPADLVRAVAAAFWQSEQADLLAPYAERYFEVLPAVWSGSGGHLRVALASALFPITAAGRGLLSRVDAFLAGGREPGLARVLAERRDLVQRATRSRALSLAPAPAPVPAPVGRAERGAQPGC
jgi:aminopeptidase N